MAAILSRPKCVNRTMSLVCYHGDASLTHWPLGGLLVSYFFIIITLWDIYSHGHSFERRMGLRLSEIRSL